MSEVKRYYFEGYELCEVTDGSESVLDWVQAPDFDAQRLRTDTAEAELSKMTEFRDNAAKKIFRMRAEITAAEQRIAELSANNQQLRKFLEQTLAALNPTKALSKSIRAALNPNPEAESHE